MSGAQRVEAGIAISAEEWRKDNGGCLTAATNMSAVESGWRECSKVCSRATGIYI